MQRPKNGMDQDGSGPGFDWREHDWFEVDWSLLEWFSTDKGVADG